MNLLHVPALVDSNSNNRSQFLLCQMSGTVLIPEEGESKITALQYLTLQWSTGTVKEPFQGTMLWQYTEGLLT